MSFQWELYRDFNPDLVAAGLKTKRDFETHWRNHGCREGRKYSVIQLTEPHFIIGVILMGGLGNRIYQIASAYGVARRQNKKLYVVEVKNNPHSGEDYFKSIFRNVIVRTEYRPLIQYMFREPADSPLAYCEVPNVLDNVVLLGYFQCPRYFTEYRDELRQLFRIEDWRRDYLNDKYPDHRDRYFIHVRRGDYLHVPLHNVDLRQYYKRAIDTIGRDKHYSVVSDDLEWCKRWSELSGLKVIFIEENELNTFYVLWNSRGGICANSSFSAIAGYLGGGQVTLPKTWFMDGNAKRIDNGWAEAIQIEC